MSESHFSKITRKLIVVFAGLFLLLSGSTYASHLMGGDFTYTFVSKVGNTMTYKVSMRLYRDCNSGTQFPATATIGIYYANNNTSYGTMTLNRAAGYNTEKSITPTCIPGAGICIAEMLYENTQSFPATNNTGFYLSAGSCCRNNGINNLQAPGSTGMGWKLYIPPAGGSLFNNSVNFSTKPLPFICTGDTVSFNHLAFDADGDSLSYSLVVPYNGGGAAGINAVAPNLGTITYNAAGGYNTSKPLGTDSYIGINPETGELSLFMGSSKVGVVSVEINEYRKNANGTYTWVGAVRRDLQIISGVCANYNPPSFVIPSGFNSTTFFNRTVNPEDTICFNITGVDSLGDSLYISANGSIFDGSDGQCSPYATFQADTADSVITKAFCWTPGCCRAGKTYIFTVNLQDNNCASKQKTFSIKVNNNSNPTAPQVRCADILSNTSVKLTWKEPSSFWKNKKYIIYRRTLSGSFAKIDSVTPGSGGYTDNSAASAQSIRYQYMVTAISRCDTASRGDTISTILPTAVTPLAYKCNLYWTSPKAAYKPTYLKIYRNNGAGGWTYLDSTRKDTFYYFARRCTDTVQFLVQAYDSVWGCSSFSMFSNSVVLFDQYAPDSQNILRTTVTLNGKIQIDFKKNDSLDTKKYLIYRKLPGGSYTLWDSIASTGASSYTKIDSTISVNNCPELPSYKMVAIDSCGNIGVFGNVHSPVNLRGAPGSQVNYLVWRNYLGFNYDSFFVYRYNNSGVPIRYKTLQKTDTTFIDSNLICNKLYTYILRYVNYKQDSTIFAESDTLQLTPFDSVAPAPARMNLVSVSSDTKVSLSFFASGSADVKYYDIYRITNGGSASLIKTLIYPAITGGLITYTDSSLNCLADRYCYYIIARDSCKNLSSVPSNVHCDIQLIGAPGNNRVYLSWMKYTGKGMKDYSVQKFNGTAWNTIKVLTASDSLYEDSSAVNCTGNRYRILGTDSSGALLSYSDTTNITPFDTIAPLKVNIRKVTVVNQSAVYLNWSNSSPDVNRYILYRGMNGSTPVAYDTLTSADTAYTDSLLNCADNVYSYALEALDSCASNSSGLSKIHQSINLSKQLDFCQKKLILRWNTYQNWNGGVSGYQILRSTNGGSFQIEATLTSSDSSFGDTVSFYNQYTYRIKAIENGGLNSNSLSDSISFYYRPIKGPKFYSVSKTATSPTTGTIHLVFDVLYYDSLVKYARIYHSTTGAAGSYTLLKDSIPVGQTSWDHINVNTSAKDHYYYMINVDTCGGFTDSTVLHKTMNLTATLKKLRNKLNWTPYKGFGVKEYIVERLDTGSTFRIIKTLSPTDTFTIDYPSPCNGYVNYRITAKDSSGNYISYSDTVNLPPIDSLAKDTEYIYNASVVNGNLIQIEYISSDSSDIFQYLLKRSTNGAGYQTVSTQYFTGLGYHGYFYDTVNTLTNEYSFLLYTMDSCLNAVPGLPFTTIQLRGSPHHLSNGIYFNKFIGYPISHYFIYQYQNGNWVKTDSLGRNDTAAYFNGLLCNTNYSYKIQGVEAGGFGRTTFSDSITLAPFDTVPPDTVPLKYITVKDYQTIELAFQPSDPDVGNYDIYFYPSNSVPVLYTTVSKTDTVWQISGLNTLDSLYRFAVVASDSCAGNKSVMSASHTTSGLHGQAGNKQALLTWTNYNGFTSPSITVQKIINGSWSNIYTSVTNTQYTDTGLGCSIHQYYRLMTISATADTSYSDSVEVIPFDTLKPRPAALKSLQVQNNNAVWVQWYPSPDNDVKNYEIWRSTNAGTWQFIADVGANLNYLDTGLDPTQNNYRYYIICYDSCNTANRSVSSDTDQTQQVYHSFLGCYPELTIYWSQYQSFGNGIKNISLVRRDTLGNQVVIPISSLATSYHDTNVLGNMNYCYIVRTVDGTGNDTALSFEYCATPIVLPVPQQANIKVVTITATGTLLGSTRITWSRNNSADTLARGYRLYHTTTPGGAMQLLYETYSLEDTAYNHDSIDTYQTKHFYTLEIFDYCNRTGALSQIHEPILLNVQAGNLENTLAWTRYAGWPVSGYNLYRSWIQNGNPYATLLVQLDSGTFSYRDTAVSCGVSYSYIVTGSNLNGNYTTISNTDTGLVFDTIPPSPIALLNTTVSETDASNGKTTTTFLTSAEKNIQSYKIYRAIGTGPFTNVQTIYDLYTSPLVYIDSGLDTKGTTHSYYITVTDSCGNESTPSDTHTTVNLTALAVNGAVKIDWTAYHGFNVTSYLIERADAPGTNWIPLVRMGSSDSEFFDSSVLCNAYYYYRIKAESPVSNLYSYSDTTSVLTFDISAPDSVEIISVSVNGSSDREGSVTIRWNKSASADAAGYLLERRLKDDMSWTPIAATGNIYRFSDQGLNTQDTVYFYRVRVLDSCGNISNYSATEHGTINIHTTPSEQSMVVQWNAYSGWQTHGYRVYRNGIYYADFDSLTTQFLDTPLTCTQWMTYQVMALNRVDTNIYSYSDSTANRAMDHTPPADTYLKTASVDPTTGKVRLEWNKADGFDVAYYEIYRKYNGTNGWRKIQSLTQADTFAYDAVDHFDGSLCYRVVASDSCSNFSNASNEGCLIYLQGAAGNYQNHLNWNPYTNWKANVKRYELWRADDSLPSELIAILNKDSLNWLDTILTYNTKNFCYRVVAYEDTGSYNAASWSNMVCLVQQPIYFIPNAFTPNDDNLNETFGPEGIYIDKYEMTIYDRWGEKVFTSSPDRLRWNGRFNNGAVVPGGLYMYQIRFYSYDGKIYNAPGTFMILR